MIVIPAPPLTGAARQISALFGAWHRIFHADTCQRNHQKVGEISSWWVMVSG
jgi:hypothetical protein